jgi:hypothetical protein
MGRAVSAARMPNPGSNASPLRNKIMGSTQNIGMYCFPEQGCYLGQRVEVCFHNDTEVTIGGEIVRDDAEEPGIAIIRLDDGRYVLTTECQWSPCQE